VFFLVEPLKYIPELLPGFIMSVRRGRKGYDKPSQKVTRYMYSLVAKQKYSQLENQLSRRKRLHCLFSLVYVVVVKQTASPVG